MARLLSILIKAKELFAGIKPFPPAFPGDEESSENGILLEDGTNLLLEDSTNLLLE